MNQIRCFQIGRFAFSVEAPEDLIYPEHFLIFEHSKKDHFPKQISYQYTLSFVEELPKIEGNPMVNRMDIQVYKRGNLETRLLGVKGQAEPYALYREVDETHAEILFVKSQSEYLTIDPAFASLFAFERRMAYDKSLIFHSAYTVYQGEAILFSAPSETGKTTQARLWEKYRGSRQVNGDRSLLMIEDGHATANGWPVCGTSEICHNESFPIKAIVMLRQSKENSVRRLKPMEAFMQIYTQVTINGWNREQVEACSDMIEELLLRVPVYELACDISEQAVLTLEDALFKK